MPGVQAAIARMLSLGYIRRADCDMAFTRSGYSRVVLAFEKPGYPIDGSSARLPLVEVSTKAQEYPVYGFTPTSEIVAFVCRDSSGVPLPSSDPTDEDATFAMVELPQHSWLAALSESLSVAHGGTPTTNFDMDDLFTKYGASCGQCTLGCDMFDLQPHDYSHTINPQARALIVRAAMNGLREGVAVGFPAYAATYATNPELAPAIGGAFFLLGYYTGVANTWTTSPDNPWLTP